MPNTLSCRTILRSRDHVLTLVPEDLEGFVEDRSQLGKDRATPDAKPEPQTHVSKVAETLLPYTEASNDSGEFAGGELVIGKDRITLCGHTVLYTARLKRIVRILEVLNQRTLGGGVRKKTNDA